MYEICQRYCTCKKVHMQCMCDYVCVCVCLRKKDREKVGETPSSLSHVISHIEILAERRQLPDLNS